MGGEAYVSRARWTWKALILALCLWGFNSVSSAARLSASRQKLEVQKHLNRLNKPAVKSIKVALLSLPFPLSPFSYYVLLFLF